MATNLRFPSAENVYLPEATGTVISFIRTESEFKWALYTEAVPAPTMNCYYMKLGVDEPVRVPSVDLFDWPDGTDRPKGEANVKHSFTAVAALTHRRDYPARLGYLELAQAQWQLQKVHTDDCTSQCLTARTKRLYNAMTTTGNFPAANVAPANTWNAGAGNWKNASDDPLSPNYLAIFKTLNAVRLQIGLATNMKVGPDKVMCVLAPQDAVYVAQSAEMTNYLRQQEDSQRVMEQGISNQMELWGVPRSYKGFKMIVESAPIVTENPKVTGTAPGNLVEATTNRQFIWQSGTAVVVSRVGALDGQYGQRSFSTVQMLYHGAMLEMQAFDHSEDRYVNLHSTENTTEVIAAGASGAIIQGIS